jgi:SET domain-containing protein
MTAYEYLKNHVNIKLAPSKLHGVGVFAIRDIKENEPIFVNWQGESGQHFITEEDLNLLEEEVRLHLHQMFFFEKIDENWLFKIILNKDCHWIYKTPHHWVNSCGFNETPNIDRENLRANRDIKKGEEILIKYGKYDKFKQNKTI